MIVYLMRHGDAEDLGVGGARRDEERALTAEGVAKLEAACAVYARLMEGPDAIQASPLRRARQTAELLARASGHQGAIGTWDCLTPDARPMQAVDLLQAEMLAGRRSIALVGHEPHMGSLLGLLLTGSERLSLPFKKGMLAAVEVRTSHSMLGDLRFCLGQKQAGRLR